MDDRRESSPAGLRARRPASAPRAGAAVARVGLAAVALVGPACASGSGPSDEAGGPDPAAAAAPRVAPDHVAVHSYADGFATFEGIEGGTELDDDEGWLFGPFLTLKVQEAGVVDEFEPPTDQAYRAADGHQLVVTYFSEVSELSTVSPMGDEHDLDVEAVVHVGDRATPLEDGLHLSQRAVVTSVPAGEVPLLEVVAEGRSQTLDLLTGELVETSHGPFEPAAQHVRYRYSGTGRLLDGLNPIEPSVEDETVNLSIEWVARTPWLAGPGYAPEGRAWLIAGPNTAGVSGMGGGIIDAGNDMYFNLLASDTFVLEDEDGTEIPAERYLIQQVMVGGGGLLIFEVPESFTTGTLHVDVGAGATWINVGIEPEPLGWEREWEDPPSADSVEIDLTEGTTAPPDVYETTPPLGGSHYTYDD